MKKSIILLFVIVCSAAIVSAWVQSDNGRAGYTGSPGESNCTNCHNSFAANSGSGSIYLTSNLINSNQYSPGQTYTINVTVKQTGLGLFGFGTEILSGVDNAGTLVITNAAKTQIKTKTVNGVIRNNVVHQLNAGLSTDSAVFTFDWVAPATNIGNVTIYFAGAACDADESETGDYIYVDSLVVTPFNTSINEIENNFSLEVFPNPVSEVVNLKYHLNKTSTVKASLVAADGKQSLVLFNESQHAGEINKFIELPEGLAKGFYLIKLESQQGNIIRKIIVK